MTSTPANEIHYSPVRLAQQWERPMFFVRRLIDEGKLVTDERGLITNASLRKYYREHGSPSL